MSETRQNVKAHLKIKCPEKIKEIENGLKFNVEILDKTDLAHLISLEDNKAVKEVFIKRSGIGLVIIIAIQ